MLLDSSPGLKLNHIDPENYTFNDETDAVEVTEENALLKGLEENCDMSLDKNNDAIIFLKNKVLENVMVHVKRSRSRRDSSAGSIASSSRSDSSKRKARSDHNKTDSKSSKLATDLKASSLPKPV